MNPSSLILHRSLSIECSIDTSTSFAMVLFIFGTIGQVFLPKLALFLISRFIAGVGGGIMLVVATIYISDITMPANRGRALVLGKSNTKRLTGHLPSTMRSENYFQRSVNNRHVYSFL
jgi:hypothetical protein